MKVKKVILLIFIVTIIICKSTIIYGKHMVELDVDLPIRCAVILQSENSKDGEERVAKLLKEKFGYESDEDKVNQKVKFDTTVKILKPSLTRSLSNIKRALANQEKLYDIKIGKHDEDDKCGRLVVGEKDLKEVYGCPNVNETEKPWNIIIIASTDYVNDSNGSAGSWKQYKFKINEVYNSYETDDYGEGKNVDIENEELDTGITGQDVVDGVTNAYNAVKKYTKFMEEFGVNQGDTIAKAICSFFTFIADIFQSLLDKIQTLPDGIPGLDFKLTFTYNELKGKDLSSQTTDTDNSMNSSDDENILTNVQTTNNENSTEETDYSILDKYTKVDKYNSDATSTDEKVLINIDNKLDKFTMETEIPVAPIDIYGITYEKIDIFSVDFLKTRQEENNSDFWNLLRNIFSKITHIVLYFSISILLTILIYHGINIIKNARDNPANRVSHIEGLRKFAIALVILTTVVIFMALCTSFTDHLIEIIRGESIEAEDKLPIRININNLYSFSTNLTGYFRFMTQSQDVSRRAAFMAKYVIIVGMNVVMSFLMVYRMLKMWFLGMIGMLTASVYALGMEEQVKFKLNLQNWAKNYAKMAAIQLLIVTVYQLIEYAMINEFI